MIRLFLADIDGCLSEPYVPFDLDRFTQLRDWSRRAESDPRYPLLGLCSGRSYAYVEAMSQALGLTAPALFESGGGRFDLPEARITWNPTLTPAVERELEAARAFLLEAVVPQSSTISFDYGKRSQAGIVSPTVGECETHLPAVEAFLEARLPDLTAYHTPYSIDIVPAGLTKVDALRWLATSEGMSLNELAFIGDTNGDAAAIQAAGAGFAPKNGSEAAQAAADVVTDGAVLSGVMEAYRWCLRRNGVEA
jgi:hydroxymethylpyrimidine pyrophosphatase-like HAD family hydrolase